MITTKQRISLRNAHLSVKLYGSKSSKYLLFMLTGVAPGLGADSRAVSSTSVPGPFLIPRLNSMVPHKHDVSEHFHWGRSRRQHMCRSNTPAKAKTLAHNMTGSGIQFTETGGAVFRKSLAWDGAHVTQARAAVDMYYLGLSQFWYKE